MIIKGKAWFLFVLCAVFISGCHEVKRSYTINPDFSGKVMVLSKTALDPLMQFGNQSGLSETEKAKRAVKRIIESTAGVDAWKDVTWNVNDEGKLEFRGTAYFRDFNTLDLDTSVTSSNRLVLAKEGSNISLQWQQVKKTSSRDKGNAAPLSGPALEKQIMQEKAKFQQSFAMMSTMLGGFREDEIFTLPGSRQSVKGFKLDGNAVVLSIVGSDILAAIKKASDDDTFWRETIAQGKEPMKDENGYLQKQLFGASLPFEAVFSDGGNQFDYNSEVAAAKTSYPAMLEALGIAEKPRPAPAERSGYSSFKSLKLGALSMVFESDRERGILPNSQDKGYTVYLVGEWNGSVDRINEVVVTEAVADNGQNLLPDESGTGFIQSPQLSGDKTAVVFPVSLKLPDHQVKSLKKLAGTVSGTVMFGAKNHDLGLMKLGAGSKSREFNFEISRSDKRSDSLGGYAVAIKLNINYNLLTGVNFYSEGNKKLEPTGTSSSCFGEDCEMEFSFEGEMPPKIGIVINAYGEMQTFTTPFVIENMPILGKLP